MKLFIKNLDPLNGKEVKIYQVSKEGSLKVPEDFSALDALGYGVGIKLTAGYDVLSTNAINHQGVLEVTLPMDKGAEFQVINDQGFNITAKSDTEVKDALRSIGLNAIELTEYIPTASGFTCDGPNASTQMGIISVPETGAMDLYYNGTKLNPAPANGRDVMGLLLEKEVIASPGPVVNGRVPLVLMNSSLTDDCQVRLVTSSTTPDLQIGLEESVGSITLENANTPQAEVNGCMTKCYLNPGIDTDKITSSILLNSTSAGATRESKLSLNCIPLSITNTPPEGESSIPLYNDIDFASERIKITAINGADNNVSYKFENVTSSDIYVAIGPGENSTGWNLSVDETAPLGSYAIKDGIIYFLLLAKN